jgi:hypothetical protein
MQEWIVDAHGNFLEELATLQVVHGPTAGNEWTCSQCGALAVLTEST